MSRQAFSYSSVPVNNHASRYSAALRIPAAKAGIPAFPRLCEGRHAGTSRVHSVDGRPHPLSNQDSHYSGLPAPAYGLSANGRNLRKRHAPTADPGIRLRTGHRRKRTERLTRRPSAHRNNCRILPPSGIACRAPYASARAKRNGTRSCHKRSGAAHRPPSAGSRERGPSASRTGTRTTFRTPSRPRVPRGKPDGSEAWSRHKARTPPKESAA